jgi:hypothetical protein
MQGDAWQGVRPGGSARFGVARDAQREPVARRVAHVPPLGLPAWARLVHPAPAALRRRCGAQRQLPPVRLAITASRYPQCARYLESGGASLHRTLCNRRCPRTSTMVAC